MRRLQWDATVNLLLGEQLLTQVCGAKHRVCLESLGVQMEHCVGDEPWKVCIV